MICQRCAAREATVLAQIVAHNQVKKAALCGECAAEAQAPSPLASFLEALASLTTRARPHNARCPSCRTSYAEFREEGLFGCPDCYENFLPQVRELLPRVHAGAYQHRGKTPGRR